uniref:T9SS type A sorting domain-containing protein n=1 Tax=candidate division WOR-3 bacterium TaxID=2052148 RepID=A0A7C3N6J2_UNCW3
MLVLIAALFTLTLQLSAQYFVSDSFDDCFIDPKWSIEKIEPAEVVEYYDNLRSLDLLKLKTLYETDSLTRSEAKVYQILPSIVQENFHQNPNDFFYLNVYGGGPSWYNTIHYYDTTSGHYSRAKANFYAKFSNGDILKIVFYRFSQRLSDPVLVFITYINNTIVNSSSYTYSTEPNFNINLNHIKDTTYTFSLDNSFTLGTLYTRGKIVEVGFLVAGEGTRNVSSASFQELTSTHFSLLNDLNDYFYNKLTFNNLKYEENNTIDVNLWKYSDTIQPYEPFKFATVKLIDHNGYTVVGPSNVNTSGALSFNITPTDTFPYRLIIQNNIAKGQIDTFILRVDYKVIKNVSKPEDVPVLKHNIIDIGVTKFGVEPQPDIATTGIPGLEVTLTDNEGFNYKGITNDSGYVHIPAYLSSNRPLTLTIDGVGYIPYTSTIHTYLWSNVRGAFGRNNQEHIVRKPNTDEMEMLYTTGDSVVYGRSEDFGQTWELEILGKGKEPALTRTKDGLIAIWKEGESTFWYSIKHSPWTPVDTLISPTVWFTEPVVGYNYTTDKTYMGYIGNRYLNIERGDYILGSMEGIDIGTLVFDTVVSYYGEDNKVPMKSPVFSLFYDISSTSISHLIGFIDTTKNYLYKLYTSKLPQWTKLRTINKSGQVCNAPTADYYGEVTTFAYEVINIDGTRDIWKAKMIDGFLTEPERINTFIGVNKYPKVKNNYLHLYVNNDKKLISEPGYGLTIEQNIIRETTDSIFSYDVNFKDTYTNRKGFFIWTEGENGFYRLNMKEVSYKTEPVPYVISLPQDTIERVTTSPLYDNNYLGRKEPVERLNTTIVGLDPEMSYNVRVITSEGSPVKPQIIQIDGEVYGVVYGHANREDTTEIVLPKGIYEDNKIVISIDRKKGNPNRVSKVEVYQYETEGEKEIVTANKVKVLQAINMTETTEVKGKKEGLKVSYISDREGEVEIEVYDIRGSRLGIMKSQVKAGLNEIGIGLVQKSGIYFVRIRDGEKGETRKINIIK